MPKPIQPLSIRAPGFGGLNTELSPADAGEAFCRVADNAIIDNFGRIAAREGFATFTTTPTNYASANVQFLTEFLEKDGTQHLVSIANNTILFGYDNPVPVTSTDLSNFTSDEDFSAAVLDDTLILAAPHTEPWVYEPATDTISGFANTSASAPSGYTTATMPGYNDILSAYGRVFYAGPQDQQDLIHVSAINSPTQLSLGDAFSISVRDYWPNGQDNIVAIGAHNGYLIVFGSNAMLIYSGLDGADPAAELALEDAIQGIGCVAKETVINTGDDLYWVDKGGLRSLGRTIQEKSAPLGLPSRNIITDLRREIDGATDLCAVYNRNTSEYLLSFPQSAYTYVFNLKNRNEDGSAKVTRWTNVRHYAFLYTYDGELYAGGAALVGKYGGVVDYGQAIRFRYYTHFLDFGNSSIEKFPKRFDCIVTGGAAADFTLYWGFDFIEDWRSRTFSIPASGTLAEYGVAEYNTVYEYGASVPLSWKRKQLGGKGNLIGIGLEADIASVFGIQEIGIHIIPGRIY